MRWLGALRCLLRSLVFPFVCIFQERGLPRSPFATCPLWTVLTTARKGRTVWSQWLRSYNNQEWPRQTKPKKGQFMNFSQGRSGTKVQCESCLFSQGKTPEFTKMGEIHELFILPLSLVWFAGATPEIICNGRALGRVAKQKHQQNRHKLSQKCPKIVFSDPPKQSLWTFFRTFCRAFISRREGEVKVSWRIVINM